MTISARYAAAVLTASLLLAAPAFAGPVQEDPALAPARGFIADMNKGDMKAAAAFYAADATIVDEFVPFHWQAPDAFGQWSAGFDKMAKADGITDAIVTLGKVVHEENGPDAHYAVFKARYTYKLKGKPMAEHAVMTFAFAKTAAGWKIAGWAWSNLTKAK